MMAILVFSGFSSRFRAISLFFLEREIPNFFGGEKIGVLLVLMLVFMIALIARPHSAAHPRRLELWFALDIPFAWFRHPPSDDFSSSFFHIFSFFFFSFSSFLLVAPFSLSREEKEEKERKTR